MASGGKQKGGSAHRRAAQGPAKGPAVRRASSAQSNSGAPKSATNTASSATTAKGASPAASVARTAVATRPAPSAASATKPGANGAIAKRIAEQPTYRSRMNHRNRMRQQRARILTIAAAVVVVGGVGWLLISHLPIRAAGTTGLKTAKSAATAHVTAAATTAATAPAATATSLACAPVSVLGLNGTPSKPNGPPTITGTLVNGPQCLQYVDVKPGSGPAIKAGDNATVNYTLWLSTGQKVQSSLDSGGSPFTVQNIGQASVITGWNLGLIGMKAGGERELIIPPALGYGAGGQPPSIPGDETLIFDISVVSIG
ncbi:MAG TPA: FKBP-type peptidyl-prolyl cis-trans isomerase [Ktedonobacterales bacterium]